MKKTDILKMLGIKPNYYDDKENHPDRPWFVPKGKAFTDKYKHIEAWMTQEEIGEITSESIMVIVRDSFERSKQIHRNLSNNIT